MVVSAGRDGLVLLFRMCELVLLSPLPQTTFNSLPGILVLFVPFPQPNAPLFLENGVWVVVEHGSSVSCPTHESDVTQHR